MNTRNSHTHYKELQWKNSHPDLNLGPLALKARPLPIAVHIAVFPLAYLNQGGPPSLTLG